MTSFRGSPRIKVEIFARRAPLSVQDREAIDSIAGKLPYSGAIQPLNMNGKRIEALGAPDTDDDAVNRGWANAAIDAAVGVIAPVVDDLAERITGTTADDAVSITDQNGFALAFIDDDRAVIAGHDAIGTDLPGRGLTDELGFVGEHMAPGRALIGGLTLVPIQGASCALVDELGFVVQWLGDPPAPAPDIIPLLTGQLAMVEGVPVRLNERRILATPDDAAVMTVDGISSFALDPASVSHNVEIVTRRAGKGQRTSIALPTVVAPRDPVGAPSFKVLLDADSIGQYQGAYLLKSLLEDWGYAPTFIGTAHGSGAGNVPDGVDGPLGECRPGWQTGNETGRYPVPYRFNSDGSFSAFSGQPGIVAPGGEAGYLASGNDSEGRLIRRYVNPFLRVAAGGDAAGIIRNGLVLDYALYCSRFSVPTPDVVVYGLGTNNALLGNDVDLFASARADDLLVMGRMRAAWPSAKIIRYVPGTSSGPDRDYLWRAAYAPVLRGIMAAHADLADPNIILAPVWAMMPSEAGFALASSTPDPITGASTAPLIDPIHPIGGTRAALYRALAGYVAAASLDLF